MNILKTSKIILLGSLFAISPTAIVLAFTIGQVPSQVVGGRAFNISYTGGTQGRFTQAEYRIGTNPNWTPMSLPTPSLPTGGVVTAIPPLGLTSPLGQFFIRITQRTCQAGICGPATATSGGSAGSTLAVETLPCKPSMANARAWISSIQFLNGTASTSPSLMLRTDGGPTTSSYADYRVTNQVRVPRVSGGTSVWPNLTLRINAGLSTTLTPLPNRTETRVAVWIDRNGDKIFASNEFVSTTTRSYGFASGTSPISITIPNSLFPNTLSNASVSVRIRLVGDLPTTSAGISTFNNELSANSCRSSFSGKASGVTTSTGETEDYVLFFPAAISSGREAVATTEDAEAYPEQTNPWLTVFPNPVRAGHMLEIRSSETAAVSEETPIYQSVVLRDMTGRQWILVPESDGSGLRIPTECRSGLYFLSNSGNSRPVRICITE